MPTRLIAPVELPESLGNWFWDHQHFMDAASVVHEAPGEIVLRLDVDPPMEGELPPTLDVPYIYVDVQGKALLAVVSESVDVRQPPTFADFRAGFSALEAERDVELRLRDRELDDLRAFKRSVSSWGGPALALGATVLLLRACF
jgi:hypothetical protein